jgi:hypothetical protein
VGTAPETADDRAIRALRELIGRETGEAPTGVNPARVTEPSRDLFGLSLSGGGIRSATFNLGLLQGLHRFGLLSRLDYLSTVSGGGYIGGFWSAWRSRKQPESGAGGKTGEAPRPNGAAYASSLPDSGASGETEGTETAGEHRVFPELTGNDGRAEAAELRHLREFSNYLSPRLGIFSWDTGRVMVSLLSPIVPSLLTALSVIALMMLSWCLAVYGLFSGGPVLSAATFLGLTGSFLWITERVWRKRGEEDSPLGYLFALLCGLLLTSLGWGFRAVLLPGTTGPVLYQDGSLLPVLPDGSVPTTLLLAPVVVWGTVAILFALGRLFTSRNAGSWNGRFRRAPFDRVHSRLLLALVSWLVITLLWTGGARLYQFAAAERELQVAAGLTGTVALLSGLFTRLRKQISEQLNTPPPASLMTRLGPFLPQLLAYGAVTGMVIGVTALLVASDRLEWLSRPAPLVIAIAAVLIVLSALVVMDASVVGLHSFYRARLARAYLGASNRNPEARGRTEEQKDDDPDLSDLSTGPCHLICCAANDLGQNELGNLRRGAESAVVSSAGFSVGNFRRDWIANESPPSLGAAITASGAAFNTLMGDRSRELGPAVTFLMAALNLRLGLWVDRETEGPWRAWLHHSLLRGLPFLQEMFGIAHSDGRHVHLSDGGHFENMGLYELIRRHCRFIIASDCGMDPDVTFADLGNLVRRARSDFGVEIRIDLSPLHPDEHGHARQTMVAGDIHYPEGDTGTLLLFKPALTGQEPADIAQYRSHNPVFPHESTTDQFYDEAQWESYRGLGEHAVESAFDRLAPDLDPGSTSYVTQLFARARREGQPVPAGFGDRLSYFAEQAAVLDEMLREPGCRTLLREVLKEIDILEDGRGLRVFAEEDLPENDRVEVEKLNEAAHPDAIQPGFVERPAVVYRGIRRQDADRVSEDPPAQREQDGMAASLHVLRRALALMEDLYIRENLEELHNHPLYVGTINYFGRWASAPLFRMWWPVLKTMYPRPFTRFVERVYNVHGDGPPDSVDGGIDAPTTAANGFARECWTAEGREEPASDQLFLPFRMRLRYRESSFWLQSALILVSRAETAGAETAGVETTGSSAGGCLFWNWRDFYVPAGLWGAGIGESFLRQLGEAPMRGSADPLASLGVRQLIVRVAGGEDRGTRALQRIANERQLYRSAGFSDIAEADVPEEIRSRLSRNDGPGTPGNTTPAQWMGRFRSPGSPARPRIRMISSDRAAAGME